MKRKNIERVFFISLITTTLVGSLQIAASFIFGSLALLALGIESFSDTATTVIAVGGFRISRKPADRKHHYGHWRAESLVTLFFAAVLLISGIRILTSSIDRLRSDSHPYISIGALLAPSISAVIFLALASYKLMIGKRGKCLPLISDAYHTFTDFLSSLSAFLGLLLVLKGYPLADPLAALVISCVIFYLGFSIGKTALYDLMETTPSEDLIVKMKEICIGTPGVKSFHRLRTRRSGPKIFVDVHIVVDPKISVKNAHKIATDIERRLKSKIPEISSVVVHVEPKD